MDPNPAATTFESEADGDVLAQQAYDEMDGKSTPAEVKKKPEESDAKPVEEQPADEDAKPSKTEEGAEQPAETEETPAEGQEKQTEESAKTVEKSEGDVVQEHAVKHNMTFAEAREDIEKTKAIVEKYKNDPMEMARALRSTQSEYDKIKTKAEQKPEDQVFEPLSDVEFRRQATEFYSKDIEKNVNQFRATYPAKSELMTDEAIIEEIVDKSLIGYKSYSKEQSLELKTQASNKRDQLLNSLPDPDKRFIPEIKAALGNISDRQILSKDFNIKNYVWWARGQRSEVEIKEAEERGFKRGQEGAKILGAKTGSSGQAPSKSAQATGLNQAQKDRAVDMFPDDLPEEAYKLFKESYADDLKKNPAFVG